MTTRRSLADWVGFVFYAVLAASAVRHQQALALFLLPTFAHEAMIAAAFLVRARPCRTLPGVVPRVVAYAGAFALLLFLQGARLWHPEWLTPTPNDGVRAFGAALWVVGSAFGIWPLWYLRRMFSVEPAARGLVTRGPYRLARHPVYAGYIVQYAGMWLLYATPAFAAALGLWLVLMVARARFEERVLAAAYPDYAPYRRAVGMFGPRLAPAPVISHSTGGS